LAKRQNDKMVILPLDKAARFQVYESRQIALAPGDRVRITQNGFTRDKQRLNNGDLKQVEGFTQDGDVKLGNGWVVPKDYGNLTHGYCVTSYSSQSKSVDRVFVAESSESFRAADREQFYVSASRFKEALTIYTDDKQQLLEAVLKSSARPSAMDLAVKQLPETAGRAAPERQGVEQVPEPVIEQAAKQRPVRKPRGIPLPKLHQMHRDLFQSRDRGVGGIEL